MVDGHPPQCGCHTAPRSEAEEPQAAGVSPGVIMANSFTFSISREMAVAYGMVEPTREEALQHYEWQLRHREEKAEARALFERAKERIAALDPEQNPIAVKVLALHAPNTDRGLPPVCSGCPEDDESGPQGWPCETAAAVCDHLGIELPVGSDVDEDYEPVHPDDAPPWQPSRIRDLFPQSFVKMDDLELFKGGADSRGD